MGYGLQPKGLRISNYSDNDQYANYSDVDRGAQLSPNNNISNHSVSSSKNSKKSRKNSNRLKSSNDGWHGASPSNSVHSTPMTKGRRKYDKKRRHIIKNRTNSSSSDFESDDYHKNGYPNTSKQHQLKSKNKNKNKR